MTSTVDIIEAEQVSVDAGCDLLDADDQLIDDISDALIPAGSEVSRNVYATIHGQCLLNLAMTLRWGSQRIRPWLSVTDATGATVRRNLGVYLPVVPERRLGMSPLAYAVTGYDKLEVLNHPHGLTYALETGRPILDAVRALIVAAGESNVAIDPTAAAKVAASTRIWPIDPQTFTIHIINDMLASVGYRGLWCDLSDGSYRSEPYAAPSTISPMWSYSPQSPRTTVGEDRIEQADYFGVPNRWVFIRNDPAGTIPVEGAGIYTHINQSDGLTSIDARQRVISTVVQLDAVDQESLIVQGNRAVENDKRLDRRIELTVGANPLHGHFDVASYDDSALGVPVQVLVQEWRLPLDGSDMTLILKGL